MAQFEMWFVVRRLRHQPTLPSGRTPKVKLEYEVVGAVYQTKVEVAPKEQDVLDLLLGLEYLDRGYDDDDNPLFTVKDVMHDDSGKFTVDTGEFWIELRPVKPPPLAIPVTHPC